MVDVVIPNVTYPLIQDDGTRKTEHAWFMFFQLLYVRVGAGDQGEPLLSGNASGPWQNPTGAGSRATFDMNWTQGISNPPTQAEVQAVVAQVSVLSKRLGQLELDLKALGAIV